ncbi:Glucan endo-1,3-alpha-glucosidase agn1 [Oleoguttula sp. CCFEE 5521]
MCVKHGYGPQLSKDFPGDIRSSFDFAACSGSKLVDMVQGQQQMSQIPDDTRLVTMQAGGNDAGFYNVARDCIYHNDWSKDYGGDYPKPGACADSIVTAEKYITAAPEGLAGGTYPDTYATILDLLDSSISAKKDGFQLYVLGYARYFNEAPESDWCNDISFSVNRHELIPNTRLGLSHELRAKINSLTTMLNDQIRDVVGQFADRGVHYVSITEGFEGHRFCEKSSGDRLADYYNNFWGSDDVWFWNPRLRGLATPVNSLDYFNEVKATEMFNATYLAPETSTEAVNFWDWTDLLNFEKGIKGILPFQGATPGLLLRPFHPTEPGHTAIKNVLKAQIKV